MAREMRRRPAKDSSCIGLRQVARGLHISNSKKRTIRGAGRRSGRSDRVVVVATAVVAMLVLVLQQE